MALGYLDDSKLYAIASAIRDKTLKSATMTVDEMPEEIERITTGAVVEPLTVTENGTYSAPAGQGYTPVTVNVSGSGGITMDDVAMRNFGRSINIPTASEVSAYAFYSYVPNPAISFTLTAPNVEVVRAYAFVSCMYLASVSLPNVSSVSSHAFNGCTSIVGFSFPELISVAQNAFGNCKSASYLYAPKLTTIGQTAFTSNSSLATVDIQACTSIGNSAFQACSKLSQVSLPNISYIGNKAFSGCVRLTSVDLTGVSAVPSLGGSQPFYSTPIDGYSATAGKFGSVYVPSSLYASFTAAQYWSLIASRIVSV